MGHITNDAQRQENAAIWACPHKGTRKEYVTEVCDFSGEEYSEWREVAFDNCGPMETVSVAQDKCKRCGKVFTY